MIERKANLESLTALIVMQQAFAVAGEVLRLEVPGKTDPSDLSQWETEVELDAAAIELFSAHSFTWMTFAGGKPLKYVADALP